MNVDCHEPTTRRQESAAGRNDDRVRPRRPTKTDRRAVIGDYADVAVRPFDARVAGVAEIPLFPDGVFDTREAPVEGQRPPPVALPIRAFDSGRAPYMPLVQGTAEADPAECLG